MVFRTLVAVLALAALVGAPGAAGARPEPRARDQRVQKLTPNAWVAMVVTRITRAGEGAAADGPAGNATIRIRIGADGTLAGAAIEESSGSAALDERTLQAARAASPFAPPPEKLLTLEGFTELSFAVEFPRSGT